MSTSSLDLSELRFVDNHAHALIRAQPREPAQFRDHFAESHSETMGRDHIGTAVHYRWALRQLATALAIEPLESDLLQRRAADFSAYARDLAHQAGLACLLLDEGYPAANEAYSHEEMEALLGVRCYRILRIETAVQDLIPAHETLDELAAAFDRELERARDAGYVGLKSIAAYRTGLQIGQVLTADAEAALRDVRSSLTREVPLRLTSKPLIDYFVWRAAAFAARHELPMQFHTGYGDPDLDLRLANPLHLRPLFEAPELCGAPLVLLHGSYPFTAEAAYLAAVYPNAYLDLAFSLPPLGLGELRRTAGIALAVAPASKLMCSSDGILIPEHYYLGATRARTVLSGVLSEMIDSGELSRDEAFATAELLLRANAKRVYRLE